MKKIWATIALALVLAGCATTTPEITKTPPKQWGIKVPVAKAVPAPLPTEPQIVLTPAQETFAKRWLHKFTPAQETFAKRWLRKFLQERAK